jgi:hypothetical protein
MISGPAAAKPEAVRLPGFTAASIVAVTSSSQQADDQQQQADDHETSPSYLLAAVLHCALRVGERKEERRVSIGQDDGRKPKVSHHDAPLVSP